MTEHCTPTGSSVDILGRPRSERRISGAGDGGYAMAALLVSLVTMGVMMSMALPVWSQAAKREREAELVFRGEQYARAVALYQRRFAGAYPPDVDSLVEQRFLRRRYKDPMMDDGQFQIIYQTQAARIGGAAATAPRPGPGDRSTFRDRFPSRGSEEYNGPTRRSDWSGEQEYRHIAADLLRRNEVQRVGLRVSPFLYPAWHCRPRRSGRSYSATPTGSATARGGRVWRPERRQKSDSWWVRSFNLFAVAAHSATRLVMVTHQPVTTRHFRRVRSRYSHPAATPVSTSHTPNSRAVPNSMAPPANRVLYTSRHPAIQSRNNQPRGSGLGSPADVMGQPVEQRASQPFGAEDLGPFVEGQIRGHERRCLLVALGEDLEQQLGAGLRG